MIYVTNITNSIRPNTRYNNIEYLGGYVKRITLKAINYAAERDKALMTSFNGTLIKLKRTTQQRLHRVIDKHR